MKTYKYESLLPFPTRYFTYSFVVGQLSTLLSGPLSHYQPAEQQFTCSSCYLNCVLKRKGKTRILKGNSNGTHCSVLCSFNECSVFIQLPLDICSHPVFIQRAPIAQTEKETFFAAYTMNHKIHVAYDWTTHQWTTTLFLLHTNVSSNRCRVNVQWSFLG